MSISSINTNLAALLAQQNISTATTSTTNDVAALSSGSRIVNASTDVAALAAGTSLQSQVNVLNTSLTVASQGSSLLQVADGSLAQIQTILQRQQAITTSAQSGSLSSTQLGFLDQEFQALTSEIDQLAGSTNFNGVSLLNGSIQGGANITTNTTNSSTTLPGAATVFTVAAGNATAGNTITLTVGNQPSVTLTFGTAAGDVGVGSTAADTAANIAAALNNSNLPQLSNIRFTASGTTTGIVQAVYTGAATSLANLPSIVATTNDGNTTAATASFGATTIGTFAAGGGGNIRVGDTFTIGTHTLTFTATGSTPSSTTVVIGASQTASLQALATALNSNSYSDLSGVTFASSGATGLTATYTGSGTPPTVNTSYTSAADETFAATTTGSTAAAGTATLATFTGNNVQLGDTFTITTSSGAATVTAGTSAVTGTSFVVGSTLANTLTNIAAAFSAGQKTTLNLTAITGTATTITGTVGAGGITSSTSSYTSASNETFTPVSGTQLTASGITGLGAGTTSAVGTPEGSLFVTDNSAASVTDYGNAVDLSKVANNAAFIGSFDGTGSIGAITANYVSTGSATTSGVTFSTVVGNDTYTTGLITNATLASTTAPVSLNFTGTNTVSGTTEGGSFALTIQPQTSISSQTQASQLATGIVSGLSTVSAYQNRSILSYNNNYAATVGTTQTATLAGSSITFNTNSFANPLISSVSVSSPGAGSKDATITAVVNGQTYTSIAGIGDTFKTNSEITLENAANPSQQITLTTGSTAATGAANGIAIDVSNASNAAAFQTALSNALGLGNANAGLTFQVGSSASDTIGISLGSATSSTLFNGVSQNVTTQQNALTAASAVGTALNTITALRATVGADEERFNYASAAIQNASQNEGAAQSTLLDTDVSSTSTSFATAQVQLQAGIAVLAQANQLSQNLLKLIQ